MCLCALVARLYEASLSVAPVAVGFQELPTLVHLSPAQEALCHADCAFAVRTCPNKLQIGERQPW